MEKIKNFFKRLFSGLTKQRKSGFSLIELLVVIGIIGVLAAVAIPAYNNYRDSAGQGSLNASLKNVGKAHNICRLEKNLASCNSLAEINVSCDNCGAVSTPTGNDDPWCIQAENNNQKACLMVTGPTAPPVIINNWEKPDCTKTYSSFTCSTSGTGASKMTAYATGTTVCSGVSGCSGNTPTPTVATGANVACSSTATNGYWQACTTGTSTSKGDGTCTTGTGYCK